MPIRRRTRRAASLSDDERSAKRRSMPVSPPGRLARWVPAIGWCPRSPTSSGCASNAISTGSSTRVPGAGSRASARCTSRRSTTTCARGSRTRSRSRRSRRASRARAASRRRLTEAIALAHDCGHGPAGHASEEAFSPYLPNGYDHAVYGADVTLAELNLCRETLDGVRNHSWRRPTPATPEGEVVAWADRIAVRVPRLRRRSARRDRPARRAAGRRSRRSSGRRARRSSARSWPRCCKRSNTPEPSA